jgi:hypothetical protein
MGELNFIHAFIAAACMGPGLLHALPSTGQTPSTAQTPRRNMASTKSIRLSPQQLQAYAGYFRFSKNRDYVAYITAVEDGLDVRMLQTEEEFKMTPRSDSTFFNPNAAQGNPLIVTFVKDKEGTYSQVKVGKSGVWNREKDYKPIVKVELAHTPQQLKPFEGLYYREGESKISLELTEVQNKLHLRLFFNPDEMDLMPDSALHFFGLQNQTYTAKFLQQADGTITEMVIDGTDRWIKARKVSLTTEQLKAFEGKYRLKEDPDDLIRIAARDSSLVVRQLWDGKETTVNPLTNVYFYNDARKYSLDFRRDRAGLVTAVLILNKDHFEKVKD